MTPNFVEIFFDENVAEDPVLLSAKTWCPYLFWVLGNLPHTFERKAGTCHEICEKSVTIWAPRNARAPINRIEQILVFEACLINFEHFVLFYKTTFFVLF